MALPIWAPWAIAGIAATAVTGVVGAGSYFGGKRAGIKAGIKNQYVMTADGSLYTVDEYQKERAKYVASIAQGQVAAPMSPVVPEQAHLIPSFNAPQAQPSKGDLLAAVATMQQEIAGLTAALQPTA